MKNLKIILCVLFAAALLGSCEKEDLQDSEVAVEKNMDRIQFFTELRKSDSDLKAYLKMNSIEATAGSSVFKLRVVIIGPDTGGGGGGSSDPVVVPDNCTVQTEDFQESTGGESDWPVPLDHTTDNGAFKPGDILEGISFTTTEESSLTFFGVLDDGNQLVATNSVTDDLIVNVTAGDINSVSFDVFSFASLVEHDNVVTVTVIGAGGTILHTGKTPGGINGSPWQIITTAPIKQIVLSSEDDSGWPGLDNFTFGTCSEVTDTDSDGHVDDFDNCPETPNADQADTDGDGLGDVCDSVSGSDSDGDGILDAVDNCPETANSDQADADEDGVGDVCQTESDSDGDGLLDAEDNCPDTANSEQTDTDEDGLGDLCDDDDDADGILDEEDNCPLTANSEQTDTDGDGLGDLCDDDDDGDGILDTEDNCPLTANADQADADGDGMGDACDTDDDADGILDAVDNCPLTANAVQADTDSDRLGDVCDPDDDGDGVLDAADNCPLTANADQTDTDSDGEGDACDPDDDGDGVLDAADNCPLIANSDQADFDSDTVGDVCDTDDDNDGIADAADEVPFSNLEVSVIVAGCNSAVANSNTGGGTTMSDAMDALEAKTYRNHGQYLREVARLTEAWFDDGLITKVEKDALVGCAGDSN